MTSEDIKHQLIIITGFSGKNKLRLPPANAVQSDCSSCLKGINQANGISLVDRIRVLVRKVSVAVV